MKKIHITVFSNLYLVEPWWPVVTEDLLLKLVLFGVAPPPRGLAVHKHSIHGLLLSIKPG